MPGTQIKVFDKIVHVVDVLAASSQGGVTLREVQDASGLSKGTVFRILRSLELHNVAARNGDGAYVLGTRVLWWESCHRQNPDLSKLVRPRLEKLRDLTSETVAFSLLVGDRTVVVEQATSPHATSTRFLVGASAPLHAGATGRVILAHLPAARRKTVLSQRLERFTERTMTKRKRLEQELNRCVAQGFAFSEGERLYNTSSIAAPVFGPNREILGAISVSGPSDRLTHNKRNSIGALLLKESRLLTEQLTRPGFIEKRVLAAS